MGGIETIYEGGWFDDIHRIWDHQKKWTQAAAIDDEAKIIRQMRVLNDRNSLKGWEGR
jgi:hypothetical protein